MMTQCKSKFYTLDEESIILWGYRRKIPNSAHRIAVVWDFLRPEERQLRFELALHLDRTIHGVIAV
jgi:hypothetical protein